MTNEENKATDPHTQAIDIVVSPGFTSEKTRLIAIELAKTHPEIFVKLARMVEKTGTEPVAPESSWGKLLGIRLREKLAAAVGISDPSELGFDLLMAAKIILSENTQFFASNKVVAIRFVRSETGLGLSEAKSVVERIEAKLAESPKLAGEIRDFFGEDGPITALIAEAPGRSNVLSAINR
jgi:hypothetical protein